MIELRIAPVPDERLWTFDDHHESITETSGALIVQAEYGQDPRMVALAALLRLIRRLEADNAELRRRIGALEQAAKEP